MMMDEFTGVDAAGKIDLALGQDQRGRFQSISARFGPNDRRLSEAEVDIGGLPL